MEVKELLWEDGLRQTTVSSDDHHMQNQPLLDRRKMKQNCVLGEKISRYLRISPYLDFQK